MDIGQVIVLGYPQAHLGNSHKVFDVTQRAVGRAPLLEQSSASVAQPLTQITAGSGLLAVLSYPGSSGLAALSLLQEQMTTQCCNDQILLQVVKLLESCWDMQWLHGVKEMQSVLLPQLER